jgi:hypothetical protein
MSDEALLLAAARLLGPSPSVEELATSQIRFQQCTACGFRRYPPAPVCPECLASESEWMPDDGVGAIWSYCVYHRAFDPAFSGAVPYNVVLVELDSGPRMISNVLGIEPSDLRIGLRVMARPREIAPGRFLVYFVPGASSP